MLHNGLAPGIICPHPCGQHSDTVDLPYYCFHIKEEHCNVLRQNYIRIYTKSHQTVPLFKNFLEGTCPLNIQYTDRTIKPPSTLTISLCLYKK